MPKGDKYVALQKHLRNSNSSQVILSLEQIEKIIGDSLPNSATKHAAWWSNNYDHSQARAWLDAGYKTNCVSNIASNGHVLFERS